MDIIKELDDERLNGCCIDGSAHVHIRNSKSETICKEPLLVASLRSAFEDIQRYKGMIAYSLDAPDFDTCKSVLRDALDGVNGAENYDKVEGERVLLRELIEWALKQPWTLSSYEREKELKSELQMRLTAITEGRSRGGGGR